MLWSACHLLITSLSSVPGIMGTNTTGLLLDSLAPPAVSIGLVRLIRGYRAMMAHWKATALISLGPIAVIWVGLACWSVVRTIFTDHVAAWSEIKSLHAELSHAQAGVADAQASLSRESQRSTMVAQKLAAFEMRDTDLLFAHIDKEQYPLWKRREEDFAKDVTTWVLNNLGSRARDELLDMTVFTQGVTPDPVVSDQKEKLIWLDKVEANLQALSLAQTTWAIQAPVPLGGQLPSGLKPMLP